MKIRLSKEAKFLKTSLISTLTVSKVERKYFACGLWELVLSEKLQRSILVWFNLFDWLRGWRFVLIIVLYTDIARLWLTFGVKGKEKNWKRKWYVPLWVFKFYFPTLSWKFPFIFLFEVFPNYHSLIFVLVKAKGFNFRLYCLISSIFLTYTLHDWW